jgi:hypothetical protein
MIKNYGTKNGVPNIPNPPPIPEQKKVAAPGDVQLSRYLLKEMQTFGSMEQIKLAISERLSAAEKAGYRYVDRIPANQTESIMIFEKQ